MYKVYYKTRNVSIPPIPPDRKHSYGHRQKHRDKGRDESLQQGHSLPQRDANPRSRGLIQPSAFPASRTASSAASRMPYPISMLTFANINAVRKQNCEIWRTGQHITPILINGHTSSMVGSRSILLNMAAINMTNKAATPHPCRVRNPRRD
jgi:hypothetical protein